MFLRGDLQAAVTELERQLESKFDFVVDASDISVKAVNGKLRLAPGGTGQHTAKLREFGLDEDGIPIRDCALSQIGGRVSPDVPTKFLNALAITRPQVAADLLTGLLRGSGGANMVRMLDGSCRAFLSNKYRIIDNLDFATTALQAIKAHDGEVIDCYLSETRFHLTYTSPHLSMPERDTKNPGGSTKRLHRRPKGEKFELGKVYPYGSASNSETGHGGVNFTMGFFVPRCNNGATTMQVIKQVHLGSRLEKGVYQQDTITADARAIMLKCRDAVNASFSPEKWKEVELVYTTAAASEITAPSAAVDDIILKDLVPKSLRDDLLRYFGAHDQTRLGLAQAVSRLSQDVDDGQSAAELEAAAGRVLIGA